MEVFESSVGVGEANFSIAIMTWPRKSFERPQNFLSQPLQNKEFYSFPQSHKRGRQKHLKSIEKPLSKGHTGPISTVLVLLQYSYETK